MKFPTKFAQLSCAQHYCALKTSTRRAALAPAPRPLTFWVAIDAENDTIAQAKSRKLTLPMLQIDARSPDISQGQLLRCMQNQAVAHAATNRAADYALNPKSCYACTMDWNDLLGRRFARRWIFGLTALALGLLFAARFAVLPRIWTLREPLGPFVSTWPNAFLAGIDAAVSTLLTVGLTGTFLYLLVPKDVRNGRVVTVHPKDIDAELKAAVLETREYFFRGRSARYFRSTILPLIESGSRSTSATRVMWLLIPDPRDEALMDSYARFRNAAAFRGRATNWTSWDIQKEIIAAIVAFAAKSRSNPHLEFHIGLSRSFSILRLNMTDVTAVMTRDDPKLPAFKAARGTVFYESYREDIQLSIRQAGEVDLAKIWPNDVIVDALSAAAALAVLGCTSVAADAAKVAEVVEAVKKVSNPYA